MNAAKIQKKKHLNCVICGKGFNAEYDPVLNLYPVYHPTAECPNEAASCETRFYENLVQIYKCLHDCDTSMKMNALIDKVKWGSIQLKRELIGFCLNQGYLDLDLMQRIKPQEAVSDLCNEVFESRNLADPEHLQRAISFMSNAIRYLKDQLEVPQVENASTEESDTTDSHQDQQQLRRMFTIDLSTRESAEEPTSRRGMYSR